MIPSLFLLLLAILIVIIDANRYRYGKASWISFVFQSSRLKSSGISKQLLLSDDERLLPPIDSSSLSSVIKDVNTLNVKSPLQSIDLFNQLKNPNLTVGQLCIALNTLHEELKVFRSSIPSDVIQSIDKLIVRLKPTHDISFYIFNKLKYLMMRKEDFCVESHHILLLSCVEEFISSPKSILSARSYLNGWFTIDDMSIEMRDAIDKALAKALPTVTKFKVNDLEK